MGKKKKLPPEDLVALLSRLLVSVDVPMPETDFEFAETDLTFDYDLEIGTPNPRPSRSPVVPLPPLSGTHPILIRVPRTVIRSFKVEAEKKGGNYQTLMVRTLKAAAGGFV